MSFVSVNKSSVLVAKIMSDTATAKCEEAMTKLDKIREEKCIETTTHKLLDEVLPSKEETEKVLKGAEKKRKTKSGDEKRLQEEKKLKRK